MSARPPMTLQVRHASGAAGGSSSRRNRQIRRWWCSRTTSSSSSSNQPEMAARSDDAFSECRARQLPPHVPDKLD